MARYRHKSEEDLAWGKIRNTITSSVNLQFKNAREEVLNDLLYKAWEEYVKAVGSGELPAIESKYTRLARAVVADIIDAPELVHADAAPVE